MRALKEAAPAAGCTGCGACRNVCPKDAVTMREDGEGFLRPAVDPSSCVGCGLCGSVCPAVHAVSRGKERPEAYAVWSEADRAASSSGGAFSAFARAVLKRGGLVLGAAFDGRLRLSHVAIGRTEDLGALRGSKYVQSATGNAFRQVREALRARRQVLFCGTPCQVAGLRAFLGKDCGTLLTLDLVCHGVPSDRIFQSYLEKLRARLGGGKAACALAGYGFRRKNGWGIASTVTVGSRRLTLRGVDALYMEAFKAAAIFRECCYRCPYASVPRVGDCTIGDFWGIGRHGVPFRHDVSRGVSLVMANTGRGEAVLKGWLEGVFSERRPLAEALAGNDSLRMPSPRHPRRDAIVSAFLDPSRPLADIEREFRLVPRDLRTTLAALADRLGLYGLLKAAYDRYGKEG